MEKSKILDEVNNRTLLEHYRLTARTPLSVAIYPKYNHHEISMMKTTWTEKYDRFKELLNQTQGSERKELIDYGIGTFKRIIKHNSDHEVQVYFQDLICDMEKLNTNPKNELAFADFIIHNKAKEIADKLIPLIQKEHGSGTNIGFYMLALEKMGLLDYAKPKTVYNTLSFMGHSDHNGASKIATEYRKLNHVLKSGRSSPQEIETSRSRSKEIEKRIATYQAKIQTIIDSLSE